MKPRRTPLRRPGASVLRDRLLGESLHNSDVNININQLQRPGKGTRISVFVGVRAEAVFNVVVNDEIELFVSESVVTGENGIDLINDRLGRLRVEPLVPGRRGPKAVGVQEAFLR